MTGNILVVDDEEELLTMMQRALVREGYTCDTASTVSGAMDLIYENDYNIILTDKNMRSTNKLNLEGGLELMTLVKDFDPSIEIIMMTGYATTDSAVKALRLGAFDYIFKPFHMKDLLDKIDLIRKCQSLLSAETLTAFYKSFNAEMITLLDEKIGLPVEKQSDLMSFLFARMDFFFKTIKQLEQIVVEQRQSISTIAAYTEEFIENNPENEAVKEFAEEVKNLTSKRV